MAALWKQGVAADVQATAERYSDDALEDEVLAEIAAVALALGLAGPGRLSLGAGRIDAPFLVQPAAA